MTRKKKVIFSPHFKKPEEEIAYLRGKVEFLIRHAQKLTSQEKIDGHFYLNLLSPDALRARLSAMENSLSWRLTKPLRIVKRTLTTWNFENWGKFKNFLKRFKTN